MKIKVWLSLLLISSLFCSACARTAPVTESVTRIPAEQDTLKMIPDFSYVITNQMPHIYIDQIGYRSGDKKIAFFEGSDLEPIFYVCDPMTDEVVYEGTLYAVKETDKGMLYSGDFSSVTQEGMYAIRQPQVGDSAVFTVKDLIYDQKFLVLQNIVKEYSYTNVSELTYVLANMMFLQEMFKNAKVDTAFIEKKVTMLLNSQDIKTGAFVSEIFEQPIVPEQESAEQNVDLTAIGTVSLTTTAQMAGILAQYSVLYQEKDPVFASRCLVAAQRAYRYMEQYRANTDTDAWYFAAVQLFRATGQYKYRNAIAEYDAVDPALYSSTDQGYTILADFIYLRTPRGTDYARCASVLNQYMDTAQMISLNSERENFYVLENIATMNDKEVLENMIVLGIVNHVLSGQEYAGLQRNYIHYLAGVNAESQNYLTDTLTVAMPEENVNITNVSKLMIIFGNMSQS